MDKCTNEMVQDCEHRIVSLNDKSGDLFDSKIFCRASCCIFKPITRKSGKEIIAGFINSLSDEEKSKVYKYLSEKYKPQGITDDMIDWRPVVKGD